MGKTEERIARLIEQKQAALAKAKSADAALKKLRLEQSRSERIAARKKRNHNLIEHGTLMEIAGLIGEDRGTLLGGLFMITGIMKSPKDKYIMANWKTSGDMELAKREAQNHTKQKADDLPA
ncbi:conjugal transfer protein TraD [Acidithiobacillus sp. MC6.1]|nr:conjugal transfer protein TraD [Acidithiobacillus sp. MC6.1]